MDLRFRSWSPRLLFAAVLVVLAVVGVIQYQWFSRSAAVELEGALHGLESSVRQTVMREFQRYAPLIAEISALPADVSETKSRELLTKLWAAYGTGGTAPDLVSWLGWSPAGDANIEKLGPTGWMESPPLRGFSPPPLASRDRGKGLRLAWKVDDSGDTTTLGLALARGSVFLGLDSDKFFTTYVQPALLEANPGATVQWERAGRGPQPPLGGFDRDSYSFNPIKALWKGSTLPSTVTVGVPRFLDTRALSLPDLPGLGFLLLKVTLPPDAPVFGVERRLAWNWLGSSLLLLVLAAAFWLVLGQTGRLADLRRREREFVASVSHELRTPLTVIRSAADNFKRGIVSAERQGRYGELILDQSLRLGRMIEQMLEFAQAEGAPPAPVKAPLVFESWLAELRPPLDALAAERSVTLVWDVAGVPDSGLSDPEGLRLVLENLVVNAVNHAYPNSSSSPQLVRVTLRYLVPARLELTVDDDGRGIAPREAKKVFEPFYRDQVSRNTQEKGSGLGLFLAHRQARRLGGALKLESPWRRLDGSKKPGCRFTLSVPFEAGGGELAHGR